MKKKGKVAFTNDYEKAFCNEESEGETKKDKKQQSSDFPS